MEYSAEDIKRALIECGIQRGDCIYVSTSLGVVGKPPPQVRSQEELCKLFFDSIMEIIGKEGCLMAPAFSYTFGSSKATEPSTFSVETTPAMVGAFPNYMLQVKGRLRSIDPMISVVAYGEGCAECFRWFYRTSYGEDSFLSQLAKNPKAKFLHIGLGYKWLPIIHYIDWLAEVDYRYEKVFNGVIEIDGVRFNIPWLYAVRCLSDFSLPEEERVCKKALDLGIYKRSPLGRTYVYVASVAELFKIAYEDVKRDKWILAKGPPVDVVAEERKRIGFESTEPPEFNDYKEMIDFLIRLPRDPISPSYDLALNVVKKLLGGEVLNFRSGEQAFSHVVPEGWILKNYHIKRSDGKEIISSLSEKDRFSRVFRWSLPIKEKVKGDKLKRHCVVSYKDLLVFSCYNNRDWGFSLTYEEYDSIKEEEEYEVFIDSDFYLGELKVLEKKVGDGGRLAFVAYLGGPYKANENLSGLILLLMLAKAFEEAGKASTFLVVPDSMGFSFWVSKRVQNIQRYDLILHLKFCGENLPFTVITNRRSLGEKYFGIPVYLKHSSFFFGEGNSPTEERICYPDIPLVLLGRTEQPYSHLYPLSRAGRESDTNFDFNSVNDTFLYLSKLFL